MYSRTPVYYPNFYRQVQPEPGYGYNYGCGGYPMNPIAPPVVNPDESLVQDIAKYICDETADSRYYEKLAAEAPNDEMRTIIMGFSEDEKRHAQDLTMAYFKLTGTWPEACQMTEPEIPSCWADAINARILAETHDYKKYGEKYLEADAEWLKDIFFMARTDEAVHAMRMPILLQAD